MRPIADYEPDSVQRSNGRSQAIFVGAIALAAGFFLGVWVGRYSVRLGWFGRGANASNYQRLASARGKCDPVGRESS